MSLWISMLWILLMFPEHQIQNEVIAVDFVEYTPLLDDRHYNTGLMVNRMMRVVLAGMAARKTGITDPDYIAPESLNTR